MKINPKFLLATILSLTLVNSDITLPQTSSQSWINIGSEAVAKSSGGRSGGGSLRRSGSSSSRSNNSRSSRSSSGSNSPSRANSNNNRNHGSSTTIYHRETHSGYRGTSVTNPMVSMIILVLVFGVFGLIIFAVVYSILKNMGSQPATTKSKAEKVRDNDLVTVSKLQVALSSLAREVQTDLSQLSLNIDTDTEEGLLELLQESVLVLLRNSEYWSHALASSESMNIDKAESAFNQLSLVERSKLTTETLSNVNGKTKQKNMVIPDDETADYIVVTLILGTADDQPLFPKVRTTDELKEALEKLASIPPDYLLKLEVIWSPQHQADSLSYEEFITEYTEMLQLV